MILYSIGYKIDDFIYNYTRKDAKTRDFLYLCGKFVCIMAEKTKLSQQIKLLRKQYGLTQEDLSYKSGVGLRFVRDMEQGKKTLRMDKVNTVLALFGKELGVVEQERGGDKPWFTDVAQKWYDFIDASFLPTELKEKYKNEIQTNLGKLQQK